MVSEISARAAECSAGASFRASRAPFMSPLAKSPSTLSPRVESLSSDPLLASKNPGVPCTASRVAFAMLALLSTPLRPASLIEVWASSISTVTALSIGMAPVDTTQHTRPASKWNPAVEPLSPSY